MVPLRAKKAHRPRGRIQPLARAGCCLQRCQPFRTMKCSCVVTAALAYLTLAQIPQCVAASGLSEAKAKLLQHIESGERPDVKIWEEYGAAYSAHKR